MILHESMFSTETIEPVVQPHSAKVIAESFGISGLPEEVAELLAEDVNERLRDILKCATRFMEKGKRHKMTMEDFDRALKYKNFEPFYGFSAPDFIPFRYASGGGREIFFSDEKELELNDIINSPNAKAPLDVILKAHWLVIEGVQPAIPENPITSSMTEDSGSKSLINDKKSELSKLRRYELVNVRSLSTHDISVEQQLYYKEVTEGAVGSDETKRMEALNSLSSDTGLQPLVPRLVVFISEGVKCNVVQHNLALLIYLMRMVKGLGENPAVNMEKCLHDLLPAVLSCILGSQLCYKPDSDNHWALREFASRVLVQICKQYSNHVNNLQSRLGNLLAHCWKSEGSSFATLYGALYALSELGTDAVKNFILPKVPAESEKIRSALEGNAFVPTDRVGADHLKTLLVKILCTYVKSNMPNLVDQAEFRNEFGFYIGSLLHTSMVQARELPSAGRGTPSSSTSTSFSQQRITSAPYSTPSSHHRNFPSTTSSASHPSFSSTGGSGPQKVYYVRNSADSASSSAVSTPTQLAGSTNRFFPAGGPPVLTHQGDSSASVGAGQSMVVVRAIKMPQSRSSSPGVAASPDNNGQ